MVPPETPVSPLVTLAVGYGDRQVRGREGALEGEEGEAVADFATGRGQLFAAFAGQGGDAADLQRIGQAWALWDMVRFHRRTSALDSAFATVDAQALARIALPARLRP